MLELTSEVKVVDAFMTDQIRREIRAQLARKGLTQGEFAEQLSFSEVQLSRMMSGKSEGSVGAWKEIFEKLDLEQYVKAKGSA
jgi:transcriptional regulator with XRE-family HTH domain